MAAPTHQAKFLYRLLIALLVAGIAVLLGFLVGQRYEQTRWESGYDILDTGRHGMHRVLGRPGETVWLVGGRVRVCTPRPLGAPSCRMLTEPYVRFRGPEANRGPIAAGDGYVTVPGNRTCCPYLIAMPNEDAIGVVEGSLISYEPLGPSGQSWPPRPAFPTLRYDR